MLEQIAFITTFLTAVTAIVVFLTKLTRSVNEIHVLVNARMSEAITRIDQLVATLTAANVDVPDKPESHNGNF